MTPTLQALQAAAMRLSAAERAELIEQLIDTVVPQPRLHPEWDAEIARRLADLDSGHQQPVSAEQVFAEMRARIDAATQATPGV